MNKDIINKNSKGELNGYQERYFNDNAIQVRLMVKNNKFIGYIEWHGLRKTQYIIR
jgi:hypothetical protein